MLRRVQGIVGVGVDIIELERVASLRFLHRFGEFFLTPYEMELLAGNNDPVQFIASRFVVKEAVIKAFPGFLSPRDFEIVKDGKGPVVRFLSPIHERRYVMLVSISHSTQFAAGYAIAFTK